jgi:site-specific DNA-methyltransferase (adenine-specific)
MKVHFSSIDHCATTPQEFFDILNEEFNFTLDPCCLKKTAKCKKYYTPKEDGLKQSWKSESVFMNPPYGREIIKWMKKAYEESGNTKVIVCLVPSRTDTKWWHEYAMKGEIRFVKGRLKFGEHSNSAPFPSAVIIFK